MKIYIASLSAQRRKQKPRTPDEVAEAAARLILDRFPKDLKEPQGLASGGDMSKILEEIDDEEDAYPDSGRRKMGVRKLP